MNISEGMSTLVDEIKTLNLLNQYGKKIIRVMGMPLCDIALRSSLFSDENQRLLLTHPDVNAQLPKLLSSGVSEIQKETLALISLYSENVNGRRLLVRHQDLTE